MRPPAAWGDRSSEAAPARTRCRPGGARGCAPSGCGRTLCGRDRERAACGDPCLRALSAQPLIRDMVPLTKIGPGSEFAPLRVARGERVFVLTGAGVSAESGISTFRDAGGLWERHRIEDVATPEGFERDPELVWRFYSERRKGHAEVRPNPAHIALGELGRCIGDDLYLCTQNVDALHEQGGSPSVHHIHGEL